MKVEISFNMGDVITVEQELNISDGKFSKQDVINGLQSGTILTSLSTDGAVLFLGDSTSYQIGKVAAMTILHDLDYMDFEIMR